MRLPDNRDQATEGSSPTSRGFVGWIRHLAHLGCLPGDTEEDRLRKSALTIAVMLTTVLGLLWGSAYLIEGLILPASMPLGYAVVSIPSLLAFWRTKRFGPFRFRQLFLLLVLPFLFLWTLGGFINSSGVVIWSFLAPLGALMFYGARGSIPWFVAFVLVIGASGFITSPLGGREVLISRPASLAWFALNISGLALTTYLLLQYFVREKERAQAELAEKHRLLEIERERSERLLLNVLPKPIAERLKANEELIADRFDEVTVLFADIVGFTPLADRISPEELVDLLNQVFSQFDRLADERGVEKIKTIGDCYMVAAGVPVPRRDHAEAIAGLAIEMRDEVSEQCRARGLDLSLRIGIDSGPVVAGVIGRSKFSYDLWGDIVNTASRMESQGVPGEIQVSDRARGRLQHKYHFTPRGPVDIKGKGIMETFLLRELPRD